MLCRNTCWPSYRYPPLLLASWAASLASAVPYVGRFFSGDGLGDAHEWLEALDTARAQFSPNVLRQDISMLYTADWNGFVEGPTWGAWWTQNSYGTTLAALPFLPEPQRSFVKNANWMWFEWIGDGKRVGLDDPNPAPDGCLCDAAKPDGAYYKQGDGNVPIHDWALEETLSGVIMQAEQLLIDRDAPAASKVYLSLFNRTLALIESRRDAATNLLYSGVSSNLLAPSYGAWLLPNGTRVPAFLTGMSVSYVAALDRVIELERLVGASEPASPWAMSALVHAEQRERILAGLPALLAPSQTYFVKYKDPDGTLHGVLGAKRHAYIEAVSNHDAVALDVAERIGVPGLDEAIMSTMLGDDVPKNPVTGGPGLRPYSLVITNAGGLDDMEAPDTSWIWQYGTWVNGGEWATCEARMMLAYAKTGRLDFSLDSWRALEGFASIFRMDSPLVAWGSAVYQPGDPINIVYDMFGIAAALLRSLWSPRYSATDLSLTPRIPANVTMLSSSVPLLWGNQRLYVSAQGNVSAGIACVVLDGAKIPLSPSKISIPFASLDLAKENHTVAVHFGTVCPPTPSSAHGASSLPGRDALTPRAPLHRLSREAAVRALRALMPQDALLSLDASMLTLADGARVAKWPDTGGQGHDASQPGPSLQPIFRAAGAVGGRPAVVFDGATTFLANKDMPLPSQSTIIAVFQDHGTTNDCCTGVFYSGGGCNGLGTKLAPLESDPNASVLMIDWSGSPDTGTDDVKNRQIVASVVYNASGAFSFADGCLQSQTGTQVGAAGKSFMVGSRGNEMGRFLNGTISEILVYARPLNATELAAVHTYLLTKWPTIGPLRCGAPPPNCTLPVDLAASTARLRRFVAAMRAVGQFSDGLYELAHALLALESVAVWEERCAGLTNGTIAPLASSNSEKAADASYVASATRLAIGLAGVLDTYANSTDARQRVIYGLWAAAYRTFEDGE